MSQELVGAESQSPWKLLRENQIEEALVLFRREHAREKPPSHRRGLGESLMWATQYEAAAEFYEHSIEITKRFRMRSEGHYALLGSARWCLGDHKTAVTRWKEGLNAPYAVGGVCTQTPLLLIAASVIRPGIFSRSDAETLLKSKVGSPRIGERAEHWPATLGKFVLGAIPKEAMAAYWIRTTQTYDVILEPERPWLTDFYEAVLDLENGRITLPSFRELMRQRTQESSFGAWELDGWMRLTWSPEFYLARHEASQPTSKPSNSVPGH